MTHNSLIHFKPSMKKASFEVALRSKKHIAEETMAFAFEKPKEFKFKAGQHVRMTLLNPSETDAKGNSRFLTLANTPQDKELIVAMRMSDSAFKRVLNNMKVGEKVLVQILLGIPHGAFALHEDSSRPAVFLTGGIGIVPAYSMIKDATQKKLPHKMFLFYANRKPEAAPYLEDLKKFEKQNPNFKLIVTMTEDKSWKGETGFINQAMLKRYVKNLKSPIYYIAGLTKMVNAMKTLLKDLGVDENNIKAEDFEGFKMGQMNDIVNKVRSNLLLFAIAGVITIVVILHIIAAISISKTDFNLFKNPILYVMMALMLIIIPFKLKHILWFINSRKKNSVEEI